MAIAPDFLKNEISESARDEFYKKLVSPIWGTFAIYWIVFHWQFLATLFFVSEEKIWIAKNMLKSHYLKLVFVNVNDWYFYVSWVAPIVLTYLTIWRFPEWFLLPAYHKDVDYNVEKENIRLRGQQRILKEETNVEKANLEKLTETGERIKKEKEVTESLTDEERWEEELDINLKNNKGSIITPLISADTAVYKTRGDYVTRHGFSSDQFTYLEPATLSLLDQSGLINFSSEGKKVVLTPKGKYFIKRLREKNLFDDI